MKTNIKKVILAPLIFLLIFQACKKSEIPEEQPRPVPAPSNYSYNLKMTLNNSVANTETKALFAWMIQQFGKKIISGQTDAVKDFTYIKNLTGKTPLLRGYDMQPYSPRYTYTWDNNLGSHIIAPNLTSNVTENAIAWYNSNAQKPIIQFQWHWHSPLGGKVGTNTFYTSDTDFDVSKAVIEGTPEYVATLRDIDAIAVQLKKLQAAGVPILWRPLHELGGTWFWWSSKGPEVFKSLWNLMYDRLNNHHQLKNLIWMWNGNDANWYVGDDKCDMASIDFYGEKNTYPIVKSEFDKIYKITKGTKILGMSENGTIPDIDKTFAANVTWSFFMTWYDSLTNDNSDEMLKSFYKNPKVITLENR
ncbi:MAG: glycosyl hydrolase [Pelobium sp.]